MRDTLDACLNGKERFLRTSNRNITVGEARGKFIIISDNHQFDDHGLNGNRFNIEDDSYFALYSDLYAKWEKVKKHLSDARSGDKNSFYITYLSGYGGTYPYFVSSGHKYSDTDGNRLTTGLTTPGWRNTTVRPKSIIIYYNINML